MVATDTHPVLSLAVPTSLRRCFDYLPPAGIDPYDLANLRPGMRVRAPFGPRSVIAILVEIKASSDLPREKLRTIDSVLDSKPLLSGSILELLHWAARYYHHALGDVLQTALPALLRRGRLPDSTDVTNWRLTADGLGLPEGALKRAPKQAAMIKLLQDREEVGVDAVKLAGITPSIIRILVQKQLIAPHKRPATPSPPTSSTKTSKLTLNAEQTSALDAVATTLGGYHCHLLDGVTGSGKTEVYLQLIATVMQRGQQALVLIPEIGLTPQTLGRFRDRFGEDVVSFNSDLTDRERLAAWEAGRNGSARVVIGTRSSVWVPLANPGIIIVDEEHDLSYKQQDNFRYHARDVAIKRAQLERLPVVLGSATPGLESLRNARTGRYQHLVLPQRAGGAVAPTLNTIDIRRCELDNGLSSNLVERISEELGREQQVLLFINRRGYAPSLLCHDCGWLAACPACDTRLTVHRGAGRLRCHHCGHTSRLPTRCPTCASTALLAMGVGTQRTEECLNRLFPDTPVHRVDRDSTTRRGSMADIIGQVQSGRPCILIGTQMLAKGHHFPAVTLVGVLDADNGLFSADLRGAERMGQLLIQVAGRAGRADFPGQVAIQTHYPDHPLLKTLFEQGYSQFADTLLAEREKHAMPPFSYLALVRVECNVQQAGDKALTDCRRYCEQRHQQVGMLGPLPSAMPRKAGHYRHLLLIRSRRRTDLHRAIAAVVEHMESASHPRTLRWSIDIDPMETS